MNAKGLILVLCAAGCASVPPFEEQGIREVLADQEAAWDRGDIPAFMAGYADSICFIGSKGRTCGKEEVTRNYQRSYPDQAAMGDLDFTVLEVFPAGAQHAWAAGYWRLKRASDTLNGGFSLLWQKQAEGWRIIRDHSY
ncbi:MAG: nuclear transport factor 2 family protein [Flavobacteriales bacterium]|nr:nuclear transport factor 2 family protein [Flavobacteriales bacterium]